MKRVLILISFSVLCFACSKNENGETTESLLSNTAKLISDTKGGDVYELGFTVGHSGEGCPGCVAGGGTHTHVNCQGPGNACRLGSAMSVSSNSKDGIYLGVIEDPDALTDGDFFFMPDRSLYIIGSSGEFLNIPEQIVFRDEKTGEFVFYDIFFSDYQAFENR